MALLAIAGLVVGREIIRSNYYVSAYNGTVAIMRGIQGSILGYPLPGALPAGLPQRPNELSQISYGQATDSLGCQLMRLQDLRPSERTQVSADCPPAAWTTRSVSLRELSRAVRCCRPAHPHPDTDTGASAGPVSDACPQPGTTTAPRSTAPTRRHRAPARRPPRRRLLQTVKVPRQQPNPLCRPHRPARHRR